MFEIHLHITDPITVNVSSQAGSQLAASITEILTRLDRIEKKADKLIMSNQELSDLLAKIDTTTNHTAANVQVIADLDQKVSNEIDAFLAANPPGTVISQDQFDKLTANAAMLQKTSDAGDAQVAVLQAIAAKGAAVVPPPPPPVTVGP